MFIREQLISNIYDLKRGFSGDDELLDIYINSPRTCRWQNWTFEPGPYRTLAPKQQAVINNLWRNAGAQGRLGYKARARELASAAQAAEKYYRGLISIKQLPPDAIEFMTTMPEWGTYGT